jgi:hypothetical protein
MAMPMADGRRRPMSMGAETAFVNDVRSYSRQLMEQRLLYRRNGGRRLMGIVHE